MKPHRIFETSIRLWEEGGPSYRGDGRFVTMSLVASTSNDLLFILNNVFPAIGGRFRRWFRWFTIGHIFDGNNLQQKKIIKEMSSGFGGFRSPIVRDSGRILYSVADVELPLSVLELDALSDCRRELLIGTAEAKTSLEDLARLLEPFATGYDARSVGELLTKRNDLVFARFYDDLDTHCSFQWLGDELDLRSLEQELIRFRVLSLESRDALANLLKS